MLKDEIAIILLNWNNYKDTSECIDSLLKCDYMHYKIVVIDNASTDDSLQLLKERYKDADIKFLVSDENRGFSGGCNIGIAYALYKDYEFIMLLNNDTTVDSKFLSELIKASRQYPQYSIFGGKAYYYSDPKKIHMAGAKLNWLNGSYTRYGSDKYDADTYNSVREVAFTSAYFLLAKNEVFKNIGLLCEDYFFGQEEVDFGARYARYGYRVLYVPQSVIWHKVSGSHDPATLRDIYNVYRNKLIYKEKFSSKLMFVAWKLLFFTYINTIAPIRIYNMYKRYGGKNTKQEIKAVMNAAIIDSKKSKKMTREDFLKF